MLARRLPRPRQPRQAVAVLLFALLALRQGAEAQTVTSPYPFRATGATLVIDDRYQYVEFVLTNDSPLAITAWEVSYSLIRPDGTVHAGGHGVDVYRSLEDGCRRSDVGVCAVRPGQSSRVRFTISSTTEFTGVMLEPAGAIFADGSAVGTARARSFITTTFQQRDAGWRGWGKVLSVLLAAREQAGPGADGARVAFENLMKLQPKTGDGPEQQREANVAVLAARNLRGALDQHVASDQILDAMIAEARRESAMLEKHRKARP